VVSVILDNYNYAGFLPQAIESVLSQTFVDFELIIVDDGSTDNSREIIEKYNDSRIITVFKGNGGQTSAFNAGFEVASGCIIAFLDSDDYWYPQKLEKIAQAHKTSFIVQHYLAVNGGNAYRKIALNVDWSAALLKYGYMYQHSPTSALSFKHEVLAPFFPLADSTEMRGYADGCILMLAMTRAKVICLDDVLGFYRIHGKNLHANHTDSRAALWEVSVRQRKYVNKQLALRCLPELPYDNGQYICHLLSMAELGEMPIVIYGTGNSGKRVAEALDRMKVNVWGFANSNGNDNAVSPKELFDHRNEFGKILIASSAQDEIIGTLSECGLEISRIVKLAI
jgi:glycosyltransferase involved in cell wall biosynthesis